MADFLKGPQPLRKLLADMLDDWRGCPLMYGNFHIVHLRFFSSIADDPIPGYYAMDEERHMATILKSKRPSLVLNGLRQLQMALTSMNGLRSVRVMQNLSEIILKKFTLFESISWACVARTPIICRWLIQPVYRSFHQSICDKLMFTIHTSSSLPFFADYLGWVPAAVRAGIVNKEVLDELDLLTQVRSPVVFNLALSTLREQLSANLARKETLAIESCLTFLTGHAHCQSYYSIVYLRRLVGLLADVHRDALFHFCVSSMKTVRFLPAFLATCEVVKRSGDPEFTNFLVSALAEMVPPGRHRQALERLAKERLNREILELATGDVDA
jgi:hypothetical protein